MDLDVNTLAASRKLDVDAVILASQGCVRASLQHTVAMALTIQQQEFLIALVPIVYVDLLTRPASCASLNQQEDVRRLFIC